MRRENKDGKKGLVEGIETNTVYITRFRYGYVLVISRNVTGFLDKRSPRSCVQTRSESVCCARLLISLESALRPPAAGYRSGYDHVVADAKERGEGVLGNYRTLIGGERRMLCDGEGEEGVRYGFVVDTTVSVCLLFGLGTSGIRL